MRPGAAAEALAAAPPLIEDDAVDAEVDRICSTASVSWRFFAVAISAACFLRHLVRRFWNQTCRRQLRHSTAHSLLPLSSFSAHFAPHASQTRDQEAKRKSCSSSEKQGEEPTREPEVTDDAESEERRTLT